LFSKDIALVYYFQLMLMRDPVLQELNQRVVAERGMAETAIVNQLDVVEQVGDGLGAGSVPYLWR